MSQGNQDVLKWISEEYYGKISYIEGVHFSEQRRFIDLNGSHFDTLDGLPSALEFSQLVRIARPVLIKGIHLAYITLR